MLLSLAALSVALIGLASWLWLERHAIEPHPAPAVEFVTTEGERIALQSLRGKVVLVTFWSDPCAGCEAQAGLLSQLRGRLHARDLAVIAVAPAGLDANQARESARRLGLPSPVVLDRSGELARLLAPKAGAPSLVMVDRRGMIVQQLDGTVPVARIEGMVSEALAGV